MGATIAMAMQKKTSILEMLTVPRRADWRFPDEDGLYERNLDCRQLSFKEVVRWKGITNRIPILLNAFDCVYHDSSLRRSEPQFNFGWNIVATPWEKGRDVIAGIRSLFRQEGYALIRYEAFRVKFSSYYGKHNVSHWSLVVDCNENEIVLFDHAGVPDYYVGHIGRIPWRAFVEAWEEGGGELALVERTAGRDADWYDTCRELITRSAYRMLADNGLDHLNNYITTIEQGSLDSIIARLENIEFDIHYYRKIRELWLLAADKGVIPIDFISSEWVEELFYLCKCWSLILGVAMKWRKQPERNYRDKLVDYLRQTYQNELKFITEFARAAGA